MFGLERFVPARGFLASLALRFHLLIDGIRTAPRWPGRTNGTGRLLPWRTYRRASLRSGPLLARGSGLPVAANDRLLRGWLIIARKEGKHLRGIEAEVLRI